MFKNREKIFKIRPFGNSTSLKTLNNGCLNIPQKITLMSCVASSRINDGLKLLVIDVDESLNCPKWVRVQKCRGCWETRKIYRTWRIFRTVDTFNAQDSCTGTITKGTNSHWCLRKQNSMLRSQTAWTLKHVISRMICRFFRVETFLTELIIINWSFTSLSFFWSETLWFWLSGIYVIPNYQYSFLYKCFSYCFDNSAFGKHVI